MSQPTATFRVQHINVLVDDLASAIAFYRDVVGAPLCATPEQGFPSQFFQFGPDQQLHMNQIPDLRPFRAHFCLVVSDFVGVFRRAKAAGAIDVKPWGRVRRLPSGNMQMFVRDPSGNLIEISCPAATVIDADILADDLVEPGTGIFTVPAGAVPPAKV